MTDQSDDELVGERRVAMKNELRTLIIADIMISASLENCRMRIFIRFVSSTARIRFSAIAKKNGKSDGGRVQTSRYNLFM